MALLSTLNAPLAAASIGTAFTYQGRLTDAGAPAQGTYDLRFTLHEGSEGSAQVGPTLTNAATGVSNGLFTVALDFGPGVFTGDALWLEIGVRTNGTLSDFTVLLPRQALTPSPYALYAPNAGWAGTADSASGVTGLVPASQITGTLSSNNLAPGAAAANLAASGQSGVPSGGLILSSRSTDSNLLNAGYVKLGPLQVGNSWEERASLPWPAGRVKHTAVWTGSEMIVWGGAYEHMPYGEESHYEFWNDGGRYDPVANTWTAVTTTGAPAARWRHTAIWTGSEMIVWGGDYVVGSANPTSFNDGARYHPATDSWTQMNTNAAPGPRAQHTAVWTGSEMIVWGGISLQNSSSTNLNDGALYNYAANSWSAVTITGAPAARFAHTAVWTGSEMIVWGGEYIDLNSHVRNDGARYSPTAGSWAPVISNAAPTARCSHSAVWTGSEMIVWGGISYLGGYMVFPGDGGRYNPAADSWSPTSTNNAPSARSSHSTVWTGTEMIVWSGYNYNMIGYFLSDGGRYNPGANSWLPVNPAGAPTARGGHTAVWTGREMIIFGGVREAFSQRNDTYSYTPLRDLYLYQRP